MIILIVTILKHNVELMLTYELFILLNKYFFGFHLLIDDGAKK